jgi:hypothetical protein
MPELVLIIISAIITLIAIFISIVYCCNKKFRSFPFYFNIMFTFSIAVNNIIRLLPIPDKDKTKDPNIPKSPICNIQAFALTFLDKYMLTLMTVYSIIAYIGSYRIESFKIYQKLIFIILTIISIIISGVCSIIFFSYGVSGHSEYCYVYTYGDVKKIVDTIVTAILFLINLFCIIRILMKVSHLRREFNQNLIDGKENAFDNHWLRFIFDLIINIIVFVYILLLINKLLPKNWGKDLIYIILCLIVEFFFTLNSALIRYLTCQKEEENLMNKDTQRTASVSVFDDDDDFNGETEP